jgi:hypothetical protein
MSDIVLLDTSVYLNVLDVPGFNQKRDDILNEFGDRDRNDDSFFLPMATIWETGNHISHLPNGGLRYQFAQQFVKDVGKALNGNLPYKMTYFPEKNVFLEWLGDFPDCAKRQVSFGDLSIIKEWKQACNIFPMSRVLIWSLDSDLAGYDTGLR